MVFARQWGWTVAAALAILPQIFTPAFADDRRRIPHLDLAPVDIAVQISRGLSHQKAGRIDVDLPTSQMSLSGAFREQRSNATRTVADQGPLLSLGSPDAAAGARVALMSNVDAEGAIARGSLALGVAGHDGLTIDGLAFTPAGVGGAISQYATSTSLAGVAMLALVTNWNGETAIGSAAAYGVLMDPLGTRVLAVGDLNTTRRHTARKSTRQGTLALGWVWPLGETQGWTVVGRFTPSLHSVTQQLDQSTDIVINPTLADTGMPNILITHHDKARTRSLGLSFGIGLERELSRNWSIAGSVGLGLASYRTRLSQTGSSFFGDIAMQQARPAVADHGIAGLAELSVNLVRRLGARSSISVGLGGDYQTRLPSLRATDDGQTSYRHSGQANWAASIQYSYRF